MKIFRSATGERGLTAVRSRLRKNNTQLFSNTLAPLRYPDGLRSNANPILRLGESQRGVRILSKRKRGMLLGVMLVLIVPLEYKFKSISPRDADTANTLFLVVYSVPAVCELPVSLCEREFVPSDCGNKNRSTHKE